MEIRDAHVKNGCLVLDEPRTDLPEGKHVRIVVLEESGDELDDEQRAELHRSLERAAEDIKAGRVTDADVVMAEQGDIVDDMSDEEREELHRELDASIDEWRAGKLVDADEVIAEIRARRT